MRGPGRQPEGCPRRCAAGRQVDVRDKRTASTLKEALRGRGEGETVGGGDGAEGQGSSCRLGVLPAEEASQGAWGRGYACR